MEQIAKEWIQTNKGFSPAQFISPDGKLMLICNEVYEDGKIKERTHTVINLEEMKSKNQ